ncbi:MAG: LrgB family protein [Lachnospiraceae bacterium]|nr:LrgB family protein [Lachnospiraceae bacterium]MDD7026719.1 LrgB family protein [Lachnospiraceae bacterium]
MNELLGESLFFGMALSLMAYQIGFAIQKKWKKVFLNPLLIAVILIITFLLLTGISYETYQYGAKYLSYFLTPVTVCLAVPLYKQLQILRKNLAAIIISIVLGCLAHGAVVIAVLLAFGVDRQLLLSLLPKSISTAIALGVSSEIGGIQGITVIGVMVAGISGAVVGPALLKLAGVTDPIAQGLAIGSASHAVGTSKAIELGEIQAAMSSLAIVVTGILTVVIVPWIVSFL